MSGGGLDGGGLDEVLRAGARRVIGRYLAAGALFGLLFPLLSVAFLVLSGAVPATTDPVHLMALSHAQAPLLYVIDLAPLFLGAFAGFAGVKQARLVALNASLEQQVALQTASLRGALQQAEKTNDMVSHMADHDALTGLLNRRRMHQELVAAVDRARRYGGPLALVFIDLDRFKAVNDSRGHEVGDRLLAGFAELLEQQVRGSDVVGRWGGDEFVALLPQASRPVAAQFAERLQDLLQSRSIDIGGEQIAASASIGLAVFPDDGGQAGALLACADRDMYRAKRARVEALANA